MKVNERKNELKVDVDRKEMPML